MLRERLYGSKKEAYRPLSRSTLWTSLLIVGKCLFYPVQL
jgi:hypothetical protein